MQTTDYQRVDGVVGKNIHPYWKAFVLGEEFTIESTSSSIDKNKLKEGEQNFPYITRTDNNNGIDHFVPKQNYSQDEGNVITIGLDTQTVFYQPSAFYTGQNIQIIRHKQLNKFNALFIRVALQRVLSRFSWGSYGATLTRLRKSRIYLPATNDGKPDFDFMTAFMQQVEKDILTATIPILQHRLDTVKSMGVVKINELQWKEFVLSDYFNATRPTSRKEDDYPNGDTVFVASGGVNNGVTKLCRPKDEEILDKGNCLTISPVDGHCYYQSTDFLGRGGAGSSIILLYAKNFALNRYSGLFISHCIFKTASAKYSYGHMASVERIMKDKILLPATNDGKPDFDFMTAFMQQVEKDILTATIPILQHRLDTVKP